MELKDFIGKVVISEKTKVHYVIEKIDGAFIAVRTAKQSEKGTYSHYRWMTGTAPYDNAIAKGTVVFEDETLKQPFIDAYEAYRNTEDARWSNYDYWMRKD